MPQAIGGKFLIYIIVIELEKNVENTYIHAFVFGNIIIFGYEQLNEMI